MSILQVCRFCQGVISSSLVSFFDSDYYDHNFEHLLLLRSEAKCVNELVFEVGSQLHYDCIKKEEENRLNGREKNRI